MAGLFLGRGSACNWCDESSSPSESDPSVSSSVSSSVSEFSLATGCNRCSDGILPRRYQIPVVSTIYCTGHYTKTFIVEKTNNIYCVWASYDKEPDVLEPYIDYDRERLSPDCTVYAYLAAIYFGIVEEFGFIQLYCQIRYSKQQPAGVQGFVVLYQLFLTPDEAGHIDCLATRVLTRANSLDSNGDEDGFPLSVTVSPI